MRLVTLFVKLTIFGIFDGLLSTQSVKVARFACNVEWDFFCDFQEIWIFPHFFPPSLSLATQRSRNLSLREGLLDSHAIAAASFEVELSFAQKNHLDALMFKILARF